MKKIIYLKACFIFMLFLCMFSIFILSIKKSHFENIEIELNRNTKKFLENLTWQEEEKEEIFRDGCIGILKIPSIGVEAQIYEGTDREILKYWIGHFEMTPIWRTVM